MTRRCAWCRKQMGEKCPKCGSDRCAEIAKVRGKTPVYGCDECRFVFREGQGGITHGMCDSCMREAKARRSSPVTGSLARTPGKGGPEK